MANHQQWLDLTIIEKINIVGKLTHLLQNDLESYNAFKKWIDASEEWLILLFSHIKALAN